ncbi:MarR family winged helix-turn-helix transcriptional regulator [Psychromicrobium sp. YIM B11713]|uniref:MarR family winged helix-turn-helix transcriptional regulator n=1 Tax=Psychromicrobium sp. YIM B11713 TaxID=3145233 RepID=UPI00374E57F6
MSGSENSLGSSFQDADQSTGLLLWKVTNKWQAAQRAALADLGLTHVQFVLLASVVWLEPHGVITQRKLADHADTDPMMTSEVIRTLEKKGLVSRVAHPTDSRARSVSPTEAGRELARQATAVVEAVDTEYFSALRDQRNDFTQMLVKLSTQSSSAPCE